MTGDAFIACSDSKRLKPTEQSEETASDKAPPPSADAMSADERNASSAGAETSVSPIPSPVVKHDKLLVLDLNGLFIDRRMRRYVKGEREASAEVSDEEELNANAEGTANAVGAEVASSAKDVVESARLGRFYVYDRPHMREFIAWVHSKFEVGVWSSATARNTQNLVDYVWGEHRSKVAFVWGQEKCSNVGVAPSATQARPMFLKELRRVWKLKKKTGLTRFNESNTLLIDDSPYKAIRNPEHTAIHPCGFTADHIETDDMLAENGSLRRYLEELSTAASIPDFVRENPWNGGVISAEHQAQIALAHEACAIAREKEKDKILALRDVNEINLDDI